MKQVKLAITALTGILVLISCNQSPSKQEVVENLNGYWGIDKVKDKDGEEQKYKANPVVDYIEIDSSLKGCRVKVEPQMDSTFKTSGNENHFKLNKENDSLRLHFKTSIDEWEETLLSVNEDEFSVKDDRGTIYTYRRFESLEKELEGHMDTKKDGEKEENTDEDHEIKPLNKDGEG